jgi:hypothetical protein
MIKTLFRTVFNTLARYFQYFRSSMPQSVQDQARTHAHAIITQSHNAQIYTDFQLKDDLNNRTEMLWLGKYLLFSHPDFAKDLSAEQDQQLRREIHEQIFYYIEESLRQNGFTETQLSKQLTKLSKTYHTRMQHYQDPAIDMTDLLSENFNFTDLHITDLHTKDNFKQGFLNALSANITFNTTISKPHNDR